MYPGMVTVVIANHNRCDDLRQALDSVKQQDYPSVEIIVVDNASSDNSCNMLREGFPDVMAIALSENIGMDGYSVGFQRARGEFIFQMDNDSLMPDPNVLSEVVKRFNEGPTRQAVVATRVEESSQDHFSVDEVRKKDDRHGPINTGGFHAGGVGFRRAFLDEVGYYNRDVFLYASESFLLMKILAAGYQIYYYPEILMLHKSSPIARFSQGLYYEIRNRYWFLRYFGSPIQKLSFMPKMMLNDFIYAIFKGSAWTLIRALRDGLGGLPPSLQMAVRSSQPDFVRKMNEFGAEFGALAMLSRVCKMARSLAIK